VLYILVKLIIIFSWGYREDLASRNTRRLDPYGIVAKNMEELLERRSGWSLRFQVA
jgi:hypothetical protein